MTRSLIQFFKDVGSSAVGDDRRHHIWLVLEDAKRETAQSVDAEAVQADGAAALAALGANLGQIVDDRGGRRVRRDPDELLAGIRFCVGCALIIRLIIQTIRLDPSGSVWIRLDRRGT